MIRRAAILLITLTTIAAIAPWLAPYGSGERFNDFLHAPPMRPLLNGVTPVVHPLVLTNRLAQTFEVDPTRTIRLPWFQRDDRAPVFLLGADDFGHDVLSLM